MRPVSQPLSSLRFVLFFGIDSPVVGSGTRFFRLVAQDIPVLSLYCTASPLEPELRLDRNGFVHVLQEFTASAIKRPRGQSIHVIQIQSRRELM